MAENTMLNITCSSCGVTRESPVARDGTPRTPRAWKIITGDVFCPKCKTVRYVLRAVTIPVRPEITEVYDMIRSAQREATRLANWLTTQYYASDCLALATESKLPAWKCPYLYNEARQRFPLIDPNAVVAVINTVQSKYRALRFDLWRAKISLPTFRDIPLQVPKQAWRLGTDDSGALTFSFRLLAEWRTVRIRRDAQFRRQLGTIAQIMGGDTETGEGALYFKDRALMLKIAAWMPRAARGLAVGTIMAGTSTESFLIARSATGSEWRLNADHVRRWIIGATAKQTRLSEDLKAERRFPKQMRAGIVDRMGHVATIRANRMDSWMHEASRSLVNWAVRQKAATIQWDDNDKSFMPSFPWFIFRQRIEDKCKVAGVQFVYASAVADHDTAVPLAKSA
jgi:hypothetical protein